MKDKVPFHCRGKYFNFQMTFMFCGSALSLFHYSSQSWTSLENVSTSGADVAIFEMPSLRKAEILRMLISHEAEWPCKTSFLQSYPGSLCCLSICTVALKCTTARRKTHVFIGCLVALPPIWPKNTI